MPHRKLVCRAKHAKVGIMSTRTIGGQQDHSTSGLATALLDRPLRPHRRGVGDTPVMPPTGDAWSSAAAAHTGYAR